VLVSIVVPVYNVRPSYFAAAVASCVDQTWPDGLELVVVDDGSSQPNHRAYTEVLAPARARLAVTVIRKVGNAGLANARNDGIAAASGEVVVLLDGDDVLAPDAVAAIAERLSRGGFDLVYTDHDKRSADLAEVQHVRRKALFQKLLEIHAGTPLDPMLHTTFLIHCHGLRRAAMAETPFDPSYGVGDEIKLHLELSRDRPLRIGHVPEVLYHYRDNAEGICHSAQYSRLIGNIESIMAEEMGRRLGAAVTTRRAGRCPHTHAALYQHSTDDGSIVRVPYIHYEALSVVDASPATVPGISLTGASRSGKETS
jgi:glycosyltransferase involved in cell wall biosynthesis